ncbi:MAG: NAD(P)-binding protein [Candidatus Anammoxibacter sp.]
MEDQVLYDVLIVGGGPAGLSIGSGLAQNHKVLVIEKNEEIKTNRSWFCPPFVLDDVDAEIIEKCTNGGISKFMTNTFGLREYKTKGPLGIIKKTEDRNLIWESKLFPTRKYPYIKEKEILKYFTNKIDNSGNGSKIIKGCSYLNYTIKDNIVTVSTTKGVFKSRMLIDASGHDSRIVKQVGINLDRYSWWSVYGSHYNIPDDLSDEIREKHHIKEGDYQLWQTFKDHPLEALKASLNDGRAVLEYEIFPDNRCIIFILFLREHKMDKETMKDIFNNIMGNEDTTKIFKKFIKKDEIYGWYPSDLLNSWLKIAGGILNGSLAPQLSEDRIAIVGDAGCWTTPCGWGMSFILNNYKRYSKNLSKLLEKDTLDKDSLNKLTEFDDDTNLQFLVDNFVTLLLSYLPADELDEFLLLLEEIGYIYIEKVFSLVLDYDDAKSIVFRILYKYKVDFLKGILPKDNRSFIDDLAKFFKLVELLDLGDELRDGAGELVGIKPIKDHVNTDEHNIINGFKFKDLK